MTESSRTLIIACAVMKDELLAVNHAPNIQIEFLEQALHRTPAKMPSAIQEKIHQADGYDYIVLGYGSCGNGIAGVRAEKRPLVIPKAHDCITLLFGSLQAHLKEHEKVPGTYYLTKGWIEEAKDPLGVLEEYTQRYGRKTAEWVLEQEFKNYKRIVLVTNGTFDPAKYRSRARANAEFLGLAYEEIPGSLAFFEKLVQGRWDNSEFVILKPGEEVTQQVFLTLIGCPPSPA